MKNNQDKEFKRWLKNKISVTQALMIQFLITGSLSMFGLAAMSLGSNVAYGDLNQAGTGNNDAVAVGKDSKAMAESAIAIGNSANAAQGRSIAIGKGATISSGQDTIAIGTDTKVMGHTSIVLGKNAKITNEAQGTIVIGRDAFSEGSGNVGRPNTVVGRGAYTGFGENGTYRLNAATALGFGAGAGLRTDPNNGNKLINNQTNADNNVEVLVKAGYGVDEKAPEATKEALQKGNVNDNLIFYRRKHINEATAIGSEARAIGDQSIAIGGQVVAGDGVVALGGNDTEQLRNNKYQVVTDDAVNRTNVNTLDDYNLAYTESTITVAGQYKKLVGRDMPTAYKSTYGQSGSIVIGMGAHSTTALGTAIGTNSVVRMGAFGATAIGSGSTVQPNAEAAVAIGMGSVANGAYSLAAGTASWAEFGDVAIGYQAKASGKDGAIAMGRATNAQGDSSIMIGGANIKSASQQTVNFEKSTNQTIKKIITEKINGKSVKREYSFAGKTPTNGTLAQAYEELTGLKMNVDSVDFTKNKNGHASTSLGVHALSKADLGTAIGASSRADAIGSVALGVGAHATKQNAVAIGTGSTTDLVGTRQLSVSYDKNGDVVDDDSKDKAYTFNWAGGVNTSEGDVVSFGSSGAERQLKNVAAGRVAEDSTDAINGSQLNSIAKKVASGWNIAGNNKTKVSGIGTEDQVNFINGNGTTVTVEKQDEVKNGTIITTPKGANVKFDIKAKDGSITSDDKGITVNTDGTTITKDADGKLKVNTGNITNNDGKPTVAKGDENKIATAETVANAIKNSYWIASAEKDGTKKGTDDNINAGTKVIFDAGKNIEIEHDTANKFTFKTVDTPEFKDITLKDGTNKVSLTPTTDSLKLSKGDNTNSPIKITNVKDGDVSADSKDAINGSQFHKVAKNTIKLAGKNGSDTATETDGQDLDKTGGIKFTIKSSDGKLLDVVASGDTITLTPKTATLTAGTDGVPQADTNSGKLVTADDLITTLKGMGWKATAGKDGTGTVEGNAEQLIKAGETVTFKAGNNLKIKQSAKEFIYSLNPELTGLTSAEFKDAAGNISKIDGNGLTITPKDKTKKPVSITEGGINAGGNTISNVKSGLDTIKAADNKAAGLVNLNTPNVSDDNAVTVRDIKNLGWVVSSDKTTGNLTTPFSAQVKNANEVEFIGKNNAVVSATTDGNGKHTVTVDVTVPDVEKGSINVVTDESDKGKVVANKGDGDKFTTVDTVVKAINNAAWKVTSDKEGTGNTATTGHTQSKEEIKAGDTVIFKAGDNLIIKQSGKEFTYSLNPELTGLSKVEVKDDKGNTVVTTPTGTTITAKDTTDPTKDITTVINAEGTTVTDKDGNITKVDGNGITITPKNDPANPKNPVKLTKDGLDNGGNTITNVAGNLEGAKTGTKAPTTNHVGVDTTTPTAANYVNPNNAATVGDVLNTGWNLQGNGVAKDFVKAYDTLNFVDGIGTTVEVDTDTEGKKSTIKVNTVMQYTDKDGNPVKKADDGKYYPLNEQGEPDKTKPAVKDPQVSLVNAEPKDGKKPTTTPTQLGNVANGAGVYNDKVDEKGNPLTEVDGKYYTADKFENGKLKERAEATPKALDNNKFKGLSNLTNAPDSNVATVGDIKNLGWVVSSDKTTDDLGTAYNDQVKNANEVRFVGKGTATVSGKTVDGVRTITVNVNDQVSTNNSVTPVVYTKEDGTQVYPIKQTDGTTKFFENPDGTGKEVPTSEVITSLNGPEGTNKVTALKNVKGNLPQVNDEDGKVMGPDGQPYKKDGTAVTGKDKAPITADEAANIVKNSGNNAATVGDVLNAGWNLQNNGGAKDFVKPYDTVNFVDGSNTTAVVTTNTEGTASDVTYNVTGLPITYTDETGNPISKIGDKYYKVNDKGQPINEKGDAAVGKDKDGNYVDQEGNIINPIDTKKTPINTSLVNPNVDKDNQTTTPTILSNVKSNLPIVNDKEKKTFDPDGEEVHSTNKSGSVYPEDVHELLDPKSDNFVGNNAATVSDVLNAGWNIQGNGEDVDFVKPYDVVNFIDGIGTTVEVKTDDNLRTTVKFNTPTQYTDKDGNPVVKGKDGKWYKQSDIENLYFVDGKYYTKDQLNEDGTVKENQQAQELKEVKNPKVSLVDNTSESSKTPIQLGNVANGAGVYNDKVDEKGNPLTEVDGKYYTADKFENGKLKPNSEATEPNAVNSDKFKGLSNLTNAPDSNVATVGDIKNLGWVVSSDKTTGDTSKPYNDQVRNANEVKFIGKNGIQVSGKTDDKGVRTLTFEMEPGEITPTEIVKPDDKPYENVVAVGNKVYKAEDIDTNGKPKEGKDPIGTIVDGKVYADKDLKADGKPNDNASPIAKIKDNNGAKFVTGNQVAAAIEKSGFIVGKKEGLKESDFENKDEKINPNDELRFADGRNTNVKLATKEVIDSSGKVKTFTTVKVDVVDLPITYTDKDGKVVVKGKDGKFYSPEALDGKVYDEKEKTYKNPDGSALDKQPEAKENIQANLVNPNVATDKQTTTPTQLGNVANGANTFDKVDGKQIANDGKWYKEGDVLPNGKPKENATAVEKPENVGKAGLIDFEKSKPNNAATVGDLQNLGWVVSSDKTTGNTSKPYNDQVRNSNEVKFVGKNGIQVSGKTDDNGVRTLTFEMETGEITPTEIIKVDGKTKLVKVGDKAYNPEDIGTDGKAKDGAKPVGTIAKDGNVYNVTDVDDKGNVITQEGKPVPTPIATNTPNNGTKFVTGNQVADALEKSGFVVGKNNNKLSAADFENKDEKLNPNDELRFADGKNTNVKLATKEVIDASGKVKTVTTVKVDVEGLPITYTDKDGNPIVKKGDKFYLLDEKGNATNKEVKVEDIKTNLVAPNSKPNEIGTPQSLGNVASGLKAAGIKTEANNSDDKKVVKDLIDTKENDKKLNTAANLDDLKTLSKAGLDFGANVGNDVHKNLGEKVSILGNDKVTKEDVNDETKFSSKNVVTTTGKDSINIKFSQNPEFDSIKIGNRENKPVVTISSEGIDAGNTKITNVAPGEISDTSKDAINGSQLSGVLKGINAGIASSVAMANLPQVSNIGMHRHNIAAAIGIHRGESAIALGISGLNHRGSLVYKASGALNTKGHITFGVGLGYQFDRNTRDNDTHRNDIIDLKEKLEDVIRENSEYKQEIQEYRKEQEQNKVIIEQLMKRLEALEKNK